MRCLNSAFCPVPTIRFGIVLFVGARSVLTSAQPRVTQFTGSSKVAEVLVEALDGKVNHYLTPKGSQKGEPEDERLALPNRTQPETYVHTLYTRY